MKQPNGVGTAVEWNEPAPYVESLFGFKRYFTIENKICKALFDLAQKLPEPWLKVRKTVKRREKEQTACGAIQSSLYATAFAIQAASMRAAGNHRIQSTGAQICKRMQRAIGDLQPAGVHPWVVQTLNSHDEILSVNKPSVAPAVAKVVADTVAEFQKVIPLLDIEWKSDLSSWAEK